MNAFLQACRAAIGTAHVLTEPHDTAGYLTDQRGRFTGRAVAVLRPADTAEVAAIVKLCDRHRVPLVPQGGNTGLVLGSVPDRQGNAAVLSTRRLNRVRAVDPANNTMTVEAGCILQHIQQEAAAAGRLFPLSLAAEGSCTIGGNLSTNAGGTGVLRYGNTRELCLGLEVVTAQGEVMSSLRGLRKDNTGYDLRDLFIGAEGTLGVITAAVLKLFPQPRAQVTALAALKTPAQALRLLDLAQSRCGPALTGFELMSDFCLQLVCKHFPEQRLPFAQRHAQYVLLELSDSESEEHARAMFEAVIGDALEQELIDDAVIASSITQSKALWQLRENISMAQAHEGKNIKHDISVPISRIAEFIEVTDQLVQQVSPACRMVTFGHLGDGNLHYNVSPPPGVADTDFIGQQQAINLAVHDSVERFGGSISAEHGLGALKREEIRRYKSPVELKLMRAIKTALDPHHLMNPGKVI
ncbi:MULTISPECIES: FAD-binding oxidoreductase [unclassified Herbaspirillum]|uniref:FAD-binding oxidoreductase n=1 Tax=unclassified Herbaspirillum TaxID=2624150 RepID=UPI00114F8CDC|nr:MULTISPECIES: FAD-binding oxidoreductase [unclassified Herbaspirillum]MBB5391906.1 FAD/FMN-containing dehydrogenase [Herbaspirillum sp. SJZ102]